MLHPIRDQCHYRKCSIVRVGRLLDHLAGAGGQHTIEPLPGVVVHVLQKTDPGHGFGVHDVHEVLFVLPLASIFEHFLDCGLPATRGPNDTNTHSLITSLMELKHSGNLRVNALQFHLSLPLECGSLAQHTLCPLL